MPTALQSVGENSTHLTAPLRCLLWTNGERQHRPGADQVAHSTRNLVCRHISASEPLRAGRNLGGRPRKKRRCDGLPEVEQCKECRNPKSKKKCIRPADLGAAAERGALPLMAAELTALGGWQLPRQRQLSGDVTRPIDGHLGRPGPSPGTTAGAKGCPMK